MWLFLKLIIYNFYLIKFILIFKQITLILVLISRLIRLIWFHRCFIIYVLILWWSISIYCICPSKIFIFAHRHFYKASFANIFEILHLYNGAKKLKEMHNNQFGYQSNLSCKHAYFVINEGNHYYNSRKTKVNNLSNINTCLFYF